LIFNKNKTKKAAYCIAGNAALQDFPRQKYLRPPRDYLFNLATLYFSPFIDYHPNY